MKKIIIIIKREYLSRVTKKSFIITTLLLPILMLGVSGLIGYMSANSSKPLNIAVVDESGVFANKLGDGKRNKSFAYLPTTQLQYLISNYDSLNYTALLHIKPFAQQVPDTSIITLYSNSALGIEPTHYLESRINTVYQSKILADQGMSAAEIDSINKIEVSFKAQTSDNKSINSGIAAGIAGVTGFLIYITMFIYGVMVMRSVMEEKTNRIAEVIISSVKPFELMMGKVIGVALVGLTQFIIWILFIVILSSIGAAIGLSTVQPQLTEQLANAQQSATPLVKGQMSMLITQLLSFNWGKIVSCFFIYFLGGYLLYASLFAAVGSMVDEDVNDSQSLTLPITLPIIFAFVISMRAIDDPNSSIAVFGSIFPLTSPLVMMARLPFNPPMWQLILSIALLIFTFIVSVYLAGKIYRQGILMYGKKLTWGTALKWLRKG
jgi:ABC-2 type transport system permease protein